MKGRPPATTSSRIRPWPMTRPRSIRSSFGVGVLKNSVTTKRCPSRPPLRGCVCIRRLWNQNEQREHDLFDDRQRKTLGLGDRASRRRLFAQKGRGHGAAGRKRRRQEHACQATCRFGKTG